MAEAATLPTLAPVSAGADPRAARIRRFFLIGWIVIAAVFGSLFAWSVFAPFEGAVMAGGMVTVEGQHKAIQHLEGGLVAEIFVTEGMEVKEGDLLIRLDGTKTRAELDSIDARLYDLVAREARLIAERDGETQLVPIAASASGLDPAALQLTLDNQQSLLAARASSRATQIDILSQRMTQLQRRVEGLTAQVASKKRQAELVTDELEGLAELVEKNLTTRPRLLALEREQSQLLGEAESLTSDIAATQVQIGEARLEKLRLTDGFREEVISELTEVQTALATLQEERRAAVDRLKRLEIRAPRGGRVFGVRTHTVGGVIGAGEPIMHIVPADDRLVVSVRVAPQDIDKITPGQEARLRFTAFSQRETPEVAGEVLKISADAVRDEATGMTYYDVIVGLPSEQPLGDRFTLLPGMPVEAMMQTESRNVLSYLIKPLRDSVARTFRE